MIETARLVLRPYRLDDADAWYEIQRDSEINGFMRWPERTREESLAHLRDRTKHTRLVQANDFLALGIDLDGHLIGDVSLRLRTVPSPTRSVEIAWIINPAFGGQGYATEAASAMLDLAFIELEARWAAALIDVANIKSIALAERLGLRPIPVDDDTLAFFSSPCASNTASIIDSGVPPATRRTS